MKRAIAYALPVLLVAFGAAAQTAVESSSVQGIRDGIRQKLQNVREVKTEAVEQFQKQREEAKNQIEQKREEIKSTVQAKREELKTTIEVKREALKERLKVVRDEKKKQAVERIYTTLNAINERMTNHFLSVLDQVEDVLDRVQSRSEKAGANGLDISSAQAAIDEAVRAIEAARTAVREQAARSYSITVTDEATLRENAKSAREQLRSDLTAVKDVVKAARDAVRAAAVALAQIPRVNEVEVSDEAPAGSIE